ncbi:hypothetical protein CesoFtcFv8_021388 [Champsocephalus esox]|uniref:Uncharacterized protein n=1 Tax=Champsocephalus esox TaxID=159716 RepID=A0AAN8GKY4_9TELE|nr:hypothetical protein CesoFtcFv8_021388 [Champsocephalus esox]
MVQSKPGSTGSETLCVCVHLMCTPVCVNVSVEGGGSDGGGLVMSSEVELVQQPSGTQLLPVRVPRSRPPGGRCICSRAVSGRPYFM